jgi:hypothetical protein
VIRAIYQRRADDQETVYSTRDYCEDPMQQQSVNQTAGAFRTASQDIPDSDDEALIEASKELEARAS